MPSKKVPCIDCGKLVRARRCVPCFRKSRRIPPENRFWDKVDKNGPTMPHMDTPCWVWIGSRSKQGYGNFGVNGGSTKAHRFSYQLHYGEIPEGNDICHRCDNEPCIRPDHLFAGTARDNILDMEAKGRAYHPRGSNSGQAKLNEEIVIEIRNLSSQGMSYSQLVRRFKIGKTTVAHIVKRDNWKHL